MGRNISFLRLGAPGLDVDQATRTLPAPGGLAPPRKGYRHVSATRSGADPPGFGTFKNYRNRISGKDDSKGVGSAFRALVCYDCFPWQVILSL